LIANAGSAAPVESIRERTADQAEQREREQLEGEGHS
jgi:hypothetical protein